MLPERLLVEGTVEDDPEDFTLGKVWSGETVVGNLFDPEINIPDSDLLKQAGFLRADLIASILTWVNANCQGYEEDIVYSHEFDDVLGTNDCVKTEPTDEIIHAFRPSRKRRRAKPTRFVLAREGKPSKHVTVILRRNRKYPEELELIAAWIGKPARPEPVGDHDTKKNRRYWRNHALALRDLGQIDTNRPVYNSRGQIISIKQLQDLVEEEERRFAVETTVEHMRNGQFGPRYEDVYAEAKINALLSEIRGEDAGYEANKKAEEQLETLAIFAAGCLVVAIGNTLIGKNKEIEKLLPTTYKNERTRKWKKFVHLMSRQKVGDRDKDPILLHCLAKNNLKKIKAEREAANITWEKFEELEQAEAEAREEIVILIEELESRKNDPALIEAARAWTNAPDSDGLIGKSGRGFSGGLVHFFEYRSGETKRERFKTIDEPMTVDGFIAFTDRLKVKVAGADNLLNNHLLDQPGSPSENYTVVLKDARGNKRFYILRPNNDLILAYQKQGQDIKLSTMVTNSSREYVDKVAQESIDGKDRGRINKLGPKVRCIMRYYPLTPKPGENELAA